MNISLSKFGTRLSNHNMYNKNVHNDKSRIESVTATVTKMIRAKMKERKGDEEPARIALNFESVRPHLDAKY